MGPGSWISRFLLGASNVLRFESQLSERPADAAYNLWDAYSDDHIFRAATADPLGIYTVTSPATAHGSRTLTTGARRHGARHVATTSRCRGKTMWLAPRLHHPAGLHPFHAGQPPPPPKDEPPPHPGLCGNNGASSSTASSTLLQVGPTPHRLLSRQSIANIFVNFDTAFWTILLKVVFGIKPLYVVSTGLPKVMREPSLDWPTRDVLWLLSQIPPST